MRIIILFSLSVLPLLGGFFPQTVKTSVACTNGSEIKMNHSFPVTGMSGVIGVY